MISTHCNDMAMTDPVERLVYRGARPLDTAPSNLVKPPNAAAANAISAKRVAVICNLVRILRSAKTIIISKIMFAKAVKKYADSVNLKILLNEINIDT